MNVQSTSQGPLKGNICTWSWKEASLSPHLSQPVFLFPLAVMSIPRQVYCCRVCVCAKLLSCVQLFATVGAIACQAPLSMGFSRQEYWSGLPFLSPGDLPTGQVADWHWRSGWPGAEWTAEQETIKRLTGADQPAESHWSRGWVGSDHTAKWSLIKQLTGADIVADRCW